MTTTTTLTKPLMERHILLQRAESISQDLRDLRLAVLYMPIQPREVEPEERDQHDMAMSMLLAAETQAAGLRYWLTELHESSGRAITKVVNW